MNVVTYDGRAYLAAVDKKYDIIMVDAYQDITIPFQMSTVEFFTMVKEHLKEDGVMVVNMNMKGTEEGNINQYLADTIASVFSYVYTVDVEGSSNRELFACQKKDVLEVMHENMEQIEQSELKKMMYQVYDSLEEYDAGNCIMTDDKAPVELLGMQVIDEMIQEELRYYKSIFKENGIKGLLEEFS